MHYIYQTQLFDTFNLVCFHNTNHIWNKQAT
jgi:hypothetical protein